MPFLWTVHIHYVGTIDGEQRERCFLVEMAVNNFVLFDSKLSAFQIVDTRFDD